MAYFSNGTEGQYYQGKYCLHCIHDSEDVMCPIWEMHQVYNYTQCSNKTLETVLSMLWPRKGTDNAECGMFVTKDGQMAQDVRKVAEQLKDWNAGKARKV